MLSVQRQKHHSRLLLRYQCLQLPDLPDSCSSERQFSLNNQNTVRYSVLHSGNQCLLQGYH